MDGDLAVDISTKLSWGGGEDEVLGSLLPSVMLLASALEAEAEGPEGLAGHG